MDNVKEAIRAKALEIGFDTVGFCSARGRPADAANLEAFLVDGRHGAMDWMARRTGQRADPQQLWPEAKSIVVLGVNYGPEGDPLEHLGVKSKGPKGGGTKTVCLHCRPSPGRAARGWSIAGGVSEKTLT